MSNDINGPDTSVTAVNTPAKKKKKHTNVNNVRWIKWKCGGEILNKVESKHETL